MEARSNQPRATITLAQFLATSAARLEKLRAFKRVAERERLEPRTRADWELAMSEALERPVGRR